MLQQLINRSPDLKKLHDEGFDVEIRANYLLVKDIPYVNKNKEIRLGILVSELSLAGDVTTTPGTHVAMFAGDHPCNNDGSEIEKIRHQSEEKQIGDNLTVRHSFSSKPVTGSYKDYYEKMTTYVAIISSPAQSIDSSVTAKTFPLIQADDEDSVFNYIDTASSRAGIRMVSKKLQCDKIGIVGLGGTGSYVLDMVSKTPVKEIHLFDGDKFSQHNAFRSPGAPSIAELKSRPPKASYFREQYSKIHRHIIAHDYYIDDSNIDQLQGMGIVFLCLDNGSARKLITSKLENLGITFIDVGMGVQEADGSLGGILRITTSTIKQREHVKIKNRIPFSGGDGNDDYSQNIQVADLNALNASLAVIKWKKLCGFYRDLEMEHHTTYTIDTNMLLNDDQP